MQSPRPHPELLNQNLYSNRFPRWMYVYLWWFYKGITLDKLELHFPCRTINQNWPKWHLHEIDKVGMDQHLLLSEPPTCCALMHQCPLLGSSFSSLSPTQHPAFSCQLLIKGTTNPPPDMKATAFHRPHQHLLSFPLVSNISLKASTCPQMPKLQEVSLVTFLWFFNSTSWTLLPSSSHNCNISNSYNKPLTP